MARMHRSIAPALFTIALAAGTVTLAAGEAHKIKLPAPVAKALTDRYPNAVITKSGMEKEGGVEIYDVEFKDNGTERECDVTVDGTILNLESAVPSSDVPAAAMTALQKATAGGKIKKISKGEVLAEAKDGNIVKLDPPRIEYEAEFTQGGRAREVTVAENGSMLEAPKKVD